MRACIFFPLCCLVAASLIGADFRGTELLGADPAGESVDTVTGDELVTAYFRLETQKLTERVFEGIDSQDDWEKTKDEYRRQLLEMLGLDPFPKKNDLQATVTGKVDQDEFVVENLHFQSMPGLYVTANLYRPARQDGPLPAVLYVCGHGRVKKDGVSYGNKTNYQHHGAWFARNGYVCLTIDTIQLGEIEGIHHGTYREKMWWWNNRGYSPAGVEAWNCVRALDYLQSRSEVDGERIGVTGRSGGGAYSWWIAAIDDRIKAAVPVAGITSLHNHVVDGCVEGHCDCMYMVNTYRWDYPKVAALVAPRPLLISNSDKDRIFPLDGVVDVHAKVRTIYQYYDAEDKLGLQITEGPHKDTQELRVHAFRWFNRFLKNDDSLIDKTATKMFEPEALKVFKRLPDDERVTTIHESFVSAVARDDVPATHQQLLHERGDWWHALTDKTFRGWPRRDLPDIDVQLVKESVRDGIRIRKFEYTSQIPYRLPLYIVDNVAAEDSETPSVIVEPLAQTRYEEFGRAMVIAMPDEFERFKPNPLAWKGFVEPIRSNPSIKLVVCPPRGVGPTEWNREERKRTQIRRRFMQLGQTAASMQIWDVRRAIQSLTYIDGIGGHSLALHGAGDAAVWALYAAIFQPRITHLRLVDLPATNREAPDLLNVTRFTELTHLLMMAVHRNDEITATLVGDDVASTWEPALIVNSSEWSPDARFRRERIKIENR